jgi:uncharacterized cupredoxin-like copper-binding protein
MHGFFRSAAVAALLVLGASALAVAAPTTVTVRLVDSSIMGQGAGPGGNGSGMMGQGRGFGMMGGGMMGGRGGYGRGAMGQGMMAIRTDRSTVEAGEVTFDVTNWSRNLVHEMLVVAVANANVQLPYDADDQRVIEDKINSLGETEEMQPGASKTLTLDLKPGTYLLICNVAGHYAAGMWTVLTVTR